jgi:ribosomal protein S18 acetylase RimI-like enzyme
MIDEQTTAAETVEAAVMRRVVGGAPAALRAEMGVTAAELGGGAVLAMAKDPSGYWSKTLGIGITEPVTRELMAQIAAFYAVHGGDSATIQIAPSALPAEWSDIAAELRLEAGHPWVKLVRPVGPVSEEPETNLRVGMVEPALLPEWAHVLLEGFGMTRRLDRMFASTDDDAFQHVAAWDGDRIVAAATLFLHGDTAGMFGAATLPTHRCRGAQSALIALRLQLAEKAGVSWIFAETGAEGPGEHNPSLHNLRRAGFTDLYERPNWIWRRDAGG